MFDSKEICKIHVPSPDSIEGLVLLILAEMVTAKNNSELISNLKKIVSESREIDLNTMVSEIYNISTIPTSDESGFDGIDMLAKQIRPYQCQKMIDVFNKIKIRQSK